MFNAILVWAFYAINETVKSQCFRSNSLYVGRRIVVLKLQNFVRMDMKNESVWVSVSVPVRVLSRRIRGPLRREVHTSHTITMGPPVGKINC